MERVEFFMKFTEMRRKDRGMAPEVAEEILVGGDFGTLAVIGEAGYPYALPLNYAYDRKERAIYFHCAMEGEKNRAMAQEPRVSFCVVARSQVRPDCFDNLYASVIAFGKAGLAEGAVREKGLMLLIEKYSPDFLEEGREYVKKYDAVTSVYRIAVEHFTGKEKKHP